MKKLKKNFLVVVTAAFCLAAQAQQTQSDSYTRYELLDPSSQSFRIIYDVSATTAGATYYWNTLRRGSEHTVDEVIDLFSGRALEWEIVEGTVAKLAGNVRASEDTDYLQIKLARPVPSGGEARIRIDKTYRDPASFYKEDDVIVFDRSLGIRRNAVVLPAGYEIIEANYPSQVNLESDGRLAASFMNDGTGAVPYKIKARKLTEKTMEKQEEPSPWADYEPSPQGRDKSKARLNYVLNQRAFQDREIVYFLQQPETNSFRLYHDYTEKRVGIDKYVNIVRAGSKASNPSALVLDTGEELKVETLVGKEIGQKGIEIDGLLIDGLLEDTEIVVIWFDPVKEGATTRLRIEETYTDPNRFLLYQNELVWDRSFGRNRNSVVLPGGWYLTVNSIPAKIRLTDDGKVQLDYVNSRPDNIDVFIKGRRR
ncbi:MAG: hypothetical protein ABJP45_07945 [Cyclobacteriaceae bacterium]